MSQVRRVGRKDENPAHDGFRGSPVPGLVPGTDYGSRAMSAGGRGGGSVVDDDLVADRDAAVGDDVCIEPAAPGEVLDDPGSGHLLEVLARMAELDAHAIHSPDAEPLADEVVEPHAAGHDLAARLRAREPDFFERLRLDQRERLARLGAVAEVLPVALEPPARERRDRVDGSNRVGRSDGDGFDVHADSMSVVSDDADSSTTSACASASSAGGKCGFGIATTNIPAPRAERIPASESSTAAARSGATASRRAASRYTSGAGFPRATSSDETVARNSSPIPPASSTASISSRLDDDASPSGNCAATRSTASSAPGSHGGPSA